MHVIFNHGKESGPGGKKIQALAQVAESLGCTWDSIDYRDLPNPDQRVNRLVTRLSGNIGPARSPSLPLVLVRSSMGGYVATVASRDLAPKGLFLIAPAFYCPGYAVQTPSPHAQSTGIVHGWSDEVIPADHSFRFAREFGAELYLIRGDHRLNQQLPLLQAIFQMWLGRLKDSMP
jgi:surfactin synthase thioesterase subunit